MVDNKRLDELMLEKYPHIVYTVEQSDEFLKNFSGDLSDEDVVVRNFVEYVNRAETFIIIKTIGKITDKHESFIVRELNDEELAKSFVSLMRESEQYDFIHYYIAKVINY